MPKIARELTAIEISRLKDPGLVSVGGVPGLSLQITPTGSRSWTLRVKVGSKRRDMGLGPYPGVTLAQAREKARQARQSIEEGNDPILERERTQSRLKAAQASSITFEEATARTIEAKSPAWKNKKHAAQWLTTLKTYAHPVIGQLNVNDIQDAHVLEILQPLWTTKTETATRVRGRIETVLNWSAAMKFRTGPNPARWRGHLDTLLTAPKKTTVVKHHEAVPVDDAPAFYQALQVRNGLAPRALEFALLTAARSGEVRGATWTEIDLDKRTWVIPGSRMKGKKEHRVPLTPSMIRLLEALPHIPGCDLVFPSPAGKPLSDMALTGVMRRMELTAVPHGCRSTFSDWASEKTSFPRDMVEMALAHAVRNKVEAAYRRGDQFQKRRNLMNAWCQFLAVHRES